MSRAYASIFAGLPTALDLAFGESISRDQLGFVVLILMALTVLLSVVLTTDGVITGIRGRSQDLGPGHPTGPDDLDWVERLLDR